MFPVGCLIAVTGLAGGPTGLAIGLESGLTTGQKTNLQDVTSKETCDEINQKL